MLKHLNFIAFLFLLMVLPGAFAQALANPPGAPGASSAAAQASTPAPAAQPANSALPPTVEITKAGGDMGDEPLSLRGVITRFEFWNALMILFFGVIVVWVQFLLLKTKSFDGNDILKVFGVTLIIVGTLFLIAAGFGDKQIAPVMGLFGTLAGYLLGRASAETPPSAANPPPNGPEPASAGDANNANNANNPAA